MIPVPAITPAKAPSADLHDEEKSLLANISSPIRAPRKQPAIIPTAVKKMPASKPIIAPQLPALEPPDSLVNLAGIT